MILPTGPDSILKSLHPVNKFSGLPDLFLSLAVLPRERGRDLAGHDLKAQICSLHNASNLGYCKLN